jgi:predicted ATP-dependent serine protease
MSTMDLGNNSGKVQCLRDIEVPQKYYDRITTGVPLLDEVYGGQETPGILLGSSILFTGFPGAGKSTMMLQLADLLSRHAGKKILFNVGEENEYMVKMRANRLDIDGNFNVSQFADTDELIAYAELNEYDILVQDSIQTLTNGEDSGVKLIRNVGNKLVTFAKEKDVTVFIVGHITKGGEFAGPMTLKHAVDVHCHLGINKETMNRIFEMKKNRFGPGNLSYEFPMTHAGLDFRLIENPVEAVKRVSKAQKRDQFVEKAKELLLKGDKLSGYSHTDNGDLSTWIASEWEGACSGNWWREVLGLAQAELEKNNCSFTEETINRRKHVYLESN